MSTKANSKPKAQKKADEITLMTVEPPELSTATFRVYGTSPYVQNKFSGSKKEGMLRAQMSSQGTKRGKKEPRDLDADFEGACHRTVTGEYGIPAPAFRSAMISACRVAGLVMTKAKLSIFCIADDLDEEDGTPLVLLKAGEPERTHMHVRLESGVASIAVRPMWREWGADVKIRWDAKQFTQQDVLNLLERAGQQVGIGEGRNDSKKSHGMGWGTFTTVPS